jgi:hypothetical protein
MLKHHNNYSIKNSDSRGTNELISLRNGGQAMHNQLTRVLLVIAAAVGGVYHLAVLIALAAVLA